MRAYLVTEPSGCTGVILLERTHSLQLLPELYLQQIQDWYLHNIFQRISASRNYVQVASSYFEECYR
jgi:hypothetical protein